MRRGSRLLLSVLTLASGCTFHHSRQAIGADALSTPANDAHFVTEEDAGLALLGVLILSEPDHYAVLMERARRNHDCARLSHAQLDYYTDHWLLVGFPIARLTAICEPRAATEADTESITSGTETETETEIAAEAETEAEAEAETETGTETDSEISSE